ncbi:MAG: amino acid adenylation domain-containing protein [Planctomycetota bacterium]
MLLHELFAESAAVHAERIAVDVPLGPLRGGRRQRQRTSYAALQGRAQALRVAVQAFVNGEDRVAVLLPRGTADLYAAQLAVLQAGAAHVCLDPAFPDGQLAHVLADAGIVAALTDRAHAARLATAGLPADRIVCVEDAPVAPPPASSSPSWLRETSLAYVIYTSGTTGRPKGVLVEHGSIVNLIESGCARFDLGPGDRVAQGSSPAYDSSVEETWLALASGATLVPLDDDVVRLGPDLVPWLRGERITVLCPPPTLLRAMHCADPARELPDLRLCYAGGEPMPQDLADRWGAATWLENGYGPTECTVTVLRGRLLPGQPVTLGEPVPGNVAWILDDSLSPVAAGEPGELCIAGLSLARGYLGQDELTATRFPVHPELGRIYRTGDLVRRDDAGRLFFLGRTDSQVKVRGHRVELGAVEAALVHCSGVREAACTLQGDGDGRCLVAFLVPTEPGREPSMEAIVGELRTHLPAHMVPARFGVVSTLPRSVGGKLDRRALPLLPASAAVGADALATPPRDDLERRILVAFARSLDSVAALGVGDDFFALGGDSLRAARLVSYLRGEAATAALTVRDVYEVRTVAGLAARARAGTATTASASAASGRPDCRWWFTAGQVAWLALTLAAATGLLWLLAFGVAPWLLGRLGLVSVVLAMPLCAAVLAAGYTILSLTWAVAAKRVLIGRYVAGCAPVWSGFHLRHWMVERAARGVPWALVRGTALHAVALRLLGARVGRRVHIHRGVDLESGGWDLLVLGDDVVLAQEAHLSLVEIERGQIVVGGATLRARSLVDVRAVVGPDAELGEDAELSPLSYLPAGVRVAAGQRFDGVPARAAGPPAPPAAATAPGWSPCAHTVALLAARFALELATAIPLAAAVLLLGLVTGIDSDRVRTWLYVAGPSTSPSGVAALAGLAVLAVPLRLLAQALVLRTTRGVACGTFARWSPEYLRLWLRTGVVQSAGAWLSGTLMWPLWLRAAGMRVGERCEVSTILDLLPEHVSIGDESFLADGIYLGVPRLRAGAVTVAPTRLGERTFLGNHVVVPGGTTLPPDLLLGVSTVAGTAPMRAGSAWFGHPPFELPRREVVQVDRALTHDPSAVRRINRWFWELLRFGLPALPVALALLWLDAVGAAGGDAVWRAPLATLAVPASLALLVLALKWGLLGRARPGQHALWSCWASRWDFLYVAWNRYGRPLLSHLEGTLLLAFYLRAMGVRIGRRVVLGAGSAQVVDPDMLTLEDDASVHALFQAHSFEDRVLKLDRVRIGAGASVGRGAVVLYGADVGDGTEVAPQSVVMKHEKLLPRHRYVGAPTREA